MTTTSAQLPAGQSAAADMGTLTAPLLALVGFDGSAPSRAALDAATRLISGRNGHLEVVYVAHLPGSAALSPQAVAGMLEGFSTVATELCQDVRAVLDDHEPRWHFQRRDGSITHELVAAAAELRQHHGPDATVVIIVGASVSPMHHVMGSVPVALAREARFPLLVVPTLVSPEQPAAPAQGASA